MRSQGTQTQGRLPRNALLQLEVETGSLLGGSAAYGPVAFESVDSAEEQLLFQLAVAARTGALQYAAAARLRKMTDEVRRIADFFCAEACPASFRSTFLLAIRLSLITRMENTTQKVNTNSCSIISYWTWVMNRAPSLACQKRNLSTGCGVPASAHRSAQHQVCGSC